MKNKKKKGFTLVELIVVIAIIAILAAVAVPLTMQYTKQAEDKATISEIGTIKEQLPIILLEMQDAGTAFTSANFKTALEAKIKPEKVGSIMIYAKTSTAGKVKLTARIYGNKSYKAYAPQKSGNTEAAVGDTIAKTSDELGLEEYKADLKEASYTNVTKLDLGEFSATFLANDSYVLYGTAVDMRYVQGKEVAAKGTPA